MNPLGAPPKVSVYPIQAAAGEVGREARRPSFRGAAGFGGVQDRRTSLSAGGFPRKADAETSSMFQNAGAFYPPPSSSTGISASFQRSSRAPSQLGGDVSAHGSGLRRTSSKSSKKPLQSQPPPVLFRQTSVPVQKQQYGAEILEGLLKVLSSNTTTAHSRLEMGDITQQQQSAIVGTCTEKCPEEEISQREIHNKFSLLETYPQDRNRVDPSRAVKMLVIAILSVCFFVFAGFLRW